jgi:hypothetical protein
MRNNERREGNHSLTDVAQLKDLGAHRVRNAALKGEFAVIPGSEKGAH